MKFKDGPVDRRFLREMTQNGRDTLSYSMDSFGSDEEGDTRSVSAEITFGGYEGHVSFEFFFEKNAEDHNQRQLVEAQTLVEFVSDFFQHLCEEVDKLPHA